VGGDPRDEKDRFDRVRRARRQPGSAVKPLILLEAFQDCGRRKPLNPSSRVADEPLRIELPSGPWEPENFDGIFHGVIDVRTALRHSYNVPFARVAQWCGPNEVAATMRKAGLSVADDPPPSFALGSLEVTPLELAGAYTVFATPGQAWRPRGIRRVERPSGKRMDRFESRRHVVVHASTAYLVRDLLVDTVGRGTSRRAAIEDLDVAGKTGTSSGLRDAWFAGDDGAIVTVAWVGLDGGGSLGLTGGVAAAPLWKRFMERASSARPPRTVERPENVVVRRVDPETGLLVSRRSRKGHDELFRLQALPRKDRFFRRDRPEPVVR
jgi:membrane peptidoglycan carboxypeptidase